MAKCPACSAEITHVDAEMIELNPTEEVSESTEGEPSRAIATVCPECEAIIGI
ncbi:MAG: hypothetical protein ACQEQJ_04990 [Halobacteriota archaeon]|uniref:hypothetical protein n=1 Tax=Halodesulfurarchaeum sp. HSR-GB TaxID=3074077 RepID=UPI002861A25B|nr:hypothetical protein [Halodesulfurarchaeum sp. HSR-GB]MDR5656925.1 hypothetical protein [Halodesulfurarchaeum sp. HSR-GB]